MGARGNFGDHTAIRGVFVDLAEDFIGQNMPAPIALQCHNACRGFIAGGLDS